MDKIGEIDLRFCNLLQKRVDTQMARTQLAVDLKFSLLKK